MALLLLNFLFLILFLLGFLLFNFYFFLNSRLFILYDIRLDRVMCNSAFVVDVVLGLFFEIELRILLVISNFDIYNNRRIIKWRLIHNSSFIRYGCSCCAIDNYLHFCRCLGFYFLLLFILLDTSIILISCYFNSFFFFHLLLFNFIQELHFSWAMWCSLFDHVVNSLVVFKIVILCRSWNHYKIRGHLNLYRVLTRHQLL